jgi:DNA-binding NarL/FixJ family response regulator
MIRLLVVDDHDVVRMGLKQVFSGRVDMEVAAKRARAKKRSTWCARSLRRCAGDLSLSDMSGVDVLNRSKAIRPTWRCSS